MCLGPWAHVRVSCFKNHCHTLPQGNQSYLGYLVQSACWCICKECLGENGTQARQFAGREGRGRLGAGAGEAGPNSAASDRKDSWVLTSLEPPNRPGGQDSLNVGNQRLWLMTALRGRVVTKGPTLRFHGVTLGKVFPILAGSSSLCLQKLPGTVRCWLGVDRWEGKGHHCPLTPPPPRQEGPSLVSTAAAHYQSPRAPLPSAQPPGLR